MHVPPGYALFIPSAIRKAVDLPGRRRRALQGPAPGRAGAGRGPLRPRRRGAGPDRRCRLRGQGPGRRHRGDPAVPVVQPGVRRADGPQPLAGLHREPADRPRVAAPAIARAAAGAPAGTVLVVGAGPGRAAGRDRRRPAAATGSRSTSGGRSRRPGALAAIGAQPGRARRPRAQPADRVPPARRRDRVRRRRRPGLVAERGPDDVVVATGAEPARPWWVPGRRGRTWCDVRDVLDGSAEPVGAVVVVDELGFHQATSVAELLADRGCPVEVVTPGMVVGQDLGITLDMENWWIRAGGEGHRADHRPRADGRSTGADACSCSTTRPAQMQQRTPDWVVLAVPANPGRVAVPRPEGQRASSVERVGDCVAPRRAHAAVIEGERAGAAPVTAAP